MIPFFRSFKTAAIVSLFALFAANGGAWFVAQSVAWARMWVAYSHNESPGQAALHTFDGKHPCSICKEIRVARAKTRSKDAIVPFQIPEFCLASEAGTLALTRYSDTIRLNSGPPSSLTVLFSAPPTHPPQAS